jgi:DNA repair protein RecO (recombination protein O)
MLHSTEGIVFHSLKYSETSVIVKIYTELFGIQSYLIKGIRSSKSKIKPGLFQSMTLLDLVVYHKEKQTLQSVKEVRLAHPYKTIPFDIRKSSVALFINDLVYKAIREEEANPDLFAFIWQTCLDLDVTEESISFFHIGFAVRLMHHLGIFPHNNHSLQLPIFNLREGIFQASVPDHQHYLDPGNSKIFSEILNSHPTSRIPYPVSRILNPASRNQLLETILLYYQLHLPGFRGLQSHHILHDVLA